MAPWPSTAHTPPCLPADSQRLIRDFKRLRSDPPQGVNGSPNPENIMQWNAVIFGPEDTPWDGGEWLIQRSIAVTLRACPFTHAAL